MAAYRDDLLGDLAPATVAAHLSTIRGRYRAILRDNTTRAALHDQAGAWLRELGQADAPADAPIWTSQTTGERLTSPGLQLLLHRIGERAGVKHCQPHSFRRTCALMLHRSGARLTEIAALLGHSDLPTLQRYLDLQDQDAENAHRRHGPVDALGL